MENMFFYLDIFWSTFWKVLIQYHHVCYRSVTGDILHIYGDICSILS